MRKLIRLYHNWRYRRLYRKLFEKLVLSYANNPEEKVCTNAAYYAHIMFYAITGFDYDVFLHHRKQGKQQV